MNHNHLALVRFLSGLLLTALTIALYLRQKDIHPWDIKVINSIVLVTIAYTLTTVSINKLQTFPGRQSWLHILPTVGITYSLVFGVFALFFITFSNSFVLVNGLICGAFFYIDFLIRQRRTPVMAYIPTANSHLNTALPQVQWITLQQPHLPATPVQAVVVDLHAPDLTDAWQKFLAACTLQGTPVYNIRQVEESLTGRVKIRHMYENDLGSLLPAPVYLLIKQLFDTLFVLLTAPLTVPLMLLTALAIRLESPGPALFVQNRVGQKGREFKIYKFRSMRIDSERHGAQFATAGDERITRIGRFIRKTRLDELPQFWNILKGDMSLIGPRPEQKAFVENFEHSIPFYNYRHIVKPGISGWAQVMQGYTADNDTTQIKVEYDFYYIKHFSFSLDVLIFFKTIKTMLTGFGAR